MPDSSSASKAKRKPRAKVSVEKVRSEHADVLLPFFQREWGGGTIDRDGPVETQVDASTPQWICIRNDEVIGYLGTIPAFFRMGGALTPAHWLKGFWVSEPYRSGPVGPMLVESACSELDVIGSQVVDRAARRVLESYGLTDRCTLFNRVLLLQADRVAAQIDLERVGLSSVPSLIKTAVRTLQRVGVMSILGGLAGIVMRLPGLVDDRRSGAYSTRIGWDVPSAALDGLWEELCDQVHTTSDRSAAALVKRYAGGAYDLVTVWTGDDRLVAWSVVKRPSQDTDPRLAGIRVASIADILFPLTAPALGRRALGASELLSRQRGSDALLCSGSHPILERHLAARGYLAFPGNVRIMAKDGREHAFASGGENMWITRGDARSDEVF